MPGTPGHKPGISTTQVFGLPPEVATPQSESPGHKPGISTTQIFGIPASVQDGAHAHLTGEPPPAAAPQSEITLPGISARQQAPLPEESFADTVIRDRNREPDPASTAATQMFGAPDEEDLQKVWAARNGQDEAELDATEPFVPAYHSSPAPKRKAPPSEPLVTPIDPPSFGDLDSPRSKPSRGQVSRSARLDLPPEAPALFQEPRTEEGHPIAEALELRRQIRQRRTRLAAVAAAVLLLLIGGGIAARTVSSRQRTVSPDAIARRESVQLLLRRDDGRSRERAIAELEGLLASFPGYVPARADLVVALALEWDDARIQIRRLSAEADNLNRQVASLSEEKSTGDWQNRVNAMVERLGEIKRSVEPMVERTGGLDARLGDRFRALDGIQSTTPEDQVAVVRAQAVYFGVKGSDQASALAARYRQMGGPAGWDSVARAELALNARASPDSLRAARAAMDELSSKDSTFLRSYVLSARLAMAQRQSEGAIGGLEAVLALNPAHEVARQLLELARSGEQ